MQQIFHKLDLVERMVAWVEELSELGIIYEQRKAIKMQGLIDFVLEMTGLEGEQLDQCKWTLYIDGSSNGKCSGASIILKGLDDIILKYSLKFDFKVISNQAKYEALVVGL